VAAFMELALYHPEFGYYARAAQRSGRAGDFFTSVDAGPLFGELVETELAEMFTLLTKHSETATLAEKTNGAPSSARHVFDLVEAGAGNGRLAADILRAARARDPGFYAAIRLRLVEASAAARRAQPDVLGDVGERLVSSSDVLPDSFEGVLLANELIDAMPVHQVIMRPEGLREVFVDAGPSGVLTLVEGAPSTPEIAAYLEQAGVELQPGWRVEINLQARTWLRDAARRLVRGFIVLIDYGHPAGELYSAAHSGGTLTTFSGHVARGAETTEMTPPWLVRPGEQDITAHVDFTSLKSVAEAEGLETLAFLDQTYFLLGLFPSLSESLNQESTSARQSAISNLKMLILPGGLGSTHKVLIFGKGVGRPKLACTSFGERVT
jgi:SAM-dependent MidA family methyltransferase